MSAAPSRSRHPTQRLPALALVLAALPIIAGEPKKSGGGGNEVPFMSASYVLDPAGKYDNTSGNFAGADVTPRGIAVKLAPGWTAGAVFDVDTLRLAAVWSGGALKFQGVPFDGGHGARPQLGVKAAFAVPAGPGWADSAGSFKDPRPDSIAPLPRPGPIPASWGRYRGLYLHGERVIFSYTVQGCAILDAPGMSADGAVFTRALTLGASSNPLSLLVAKATDLAVGVAGMPGVQFENTPDGMVLRIPALSAPANCMLFVGASAAKDAVNAAAAAAKPEDLRLLTKGGPGRWKQAVETVGERGADNAPYAIDRITLPADNPYGASLRTGSFDLFKDGASAALGTWNGDVWVVKGIDDKLAKLTWRRFATGLHQVLGLKIVDDVIYALGRDQITRLHDLDQDGEADYYESFNHDWEVTSGFHSFCFDLHTDPDGNFLFAFGAPVRGGGRGFHKLTRHHGCVLRVSKDGSKLDVYASGLRAPNGIGVGPDGQVTSGDNQGTWVPACPLNWIKPGSFNGVKDTAQGATVHPPRALCFFPQNVDNSGGGQVWVTSDKWGPLQGELLHMSYGQSTIYKVLKEEVNGQMQGGVVTLIPAKTLTSSAMRGRFNPKDGQLYVAGLSGWQSNAVKNGGFDRVRYTGKPVQMPTGLKARKGVYEITYTCDLDASSAATASNYAVEAWNYTWTEGYGSPQVSPSGNKSAKGGHDEWTVKSAKLLPDKRTIALEIPELAPVWNVKLTLKVDSADKQPLSHVIHSTIHNLGN